MKRQYGFTLLTVAFALVFYPGFGTGAQAEIFIKRDKAEKSGTAAPAPKAPLLAPSPADEEERAEAPMPQFASIADYAETYTGNCLKQEHPLMSGDSLAGFCTCTSRNITQTMTLENVNDLFGNDSEALKQRNRMMIGVYAPCMEYPVRALISARCMEDENLAKAVSSPEALCACAADQTAAYVQKEAPAALVESLRANPDTNDPLGAFMSSEEFNRNAAQFMLLCVQKHAL